MLEIVELATDIFPPDPECAVTPIPYPLMVAWPLTASKATPMVELATDIFPADPELMVTLLEYEGNKDCELVLTEPVDTTLIKDTLPPLPELY